MDERPPYRRIIPSVVAAYGEYEPLGTVLVNEEAAERAFAGSDLDLRYHFNLPATLKPTDYLMVTFDANNLDTSGADPRYGIEIYFNGILVQPEILIQNDQLDVDYTTAPFTLASVNAEVGSGWDNIVALRGVSYNSEGGGNWMGIDYVKMDLAGAGEQPKFTASTVSNGKLTLTWTGRATSNGHRRWQAPGPRSALLPQLPIPRTSRSV